MSSTFEVISPLDGRVIATRKYLDVQALHQAADLAATASRPWRNATLDTRIAAVRAWAEAFCSDPALLAELVTIQIGRPIAQADESASFLESVETFIAMAPEALSREERHASTGIARWTTHAPLGVHLAICAWNYPVAMIPAIVVPALLAGNIVLFKHAPQVALLTDHLNAAAEACLPPGVFQAIDADHAAVGELLGSGAVQSVQFVGSQAGGQAVKAATRDAFVTVALELGGKDATYVRHDADLENSAREIASGCFSNSGQSCCSVERIYVHDSVHDRFVALLAKEAEGWLPGDPRETGTAMGPVVSKRAALTIESHVADALAKGAQIAVEFAYPGAGPDSAYVPTRILTDVSHEMLIMCEETFGPVAAVMRVKDDDAALALMDDTRFGLTAGIWTRDRDVAARFAESLDVGLFYMNRCDHADPYLPWGGMRASGLGRTDGPTAFEGVTQRRGFHFRDGA